MTIYRTCTLFVLLFAMPDVTSHLKIDRMNNFSCVERLQIFLTLVLGGLTERRYSVKEMMMKQLVGRPAP